MADKYRFIINALQAGAVAGYCSIAAIEIRESIGGADVTQTLNTTVTASHTLGGYPASNMVDDNAATFWNSNNRPQSDYDNDLLWVEFDFPDDTVDMVEYAMTNRASASLETPGIWQVQKWNGSSYDTIANRVSNADWGTQSTRAFNLSTVTTQYKFVIRDLQGATTYTSMAQIELHESISGPDITEYGADVTDAFATNPPDVTYSSDHLIDDSTTTIWNSGPNVTDQKMLDGDVWWGIELYQEVEVVEYALTFSPYTNNEPWIDWDIYWWDGADWVLLQNQTTPADWTASEERTFSLTLPILQVDTPVMDPTSGAYTSSQTITLTSANADSIYYTTDGSTPDSGDTEYTTPIAVFNGTLKAIGIASGLDDSNIASEAYTIAAAAQQPIITIIT